MVQRRRTPFRAGSVRYPVFFPYDRFLAWLQRWAKDFFAAHIQRHCALDLTGMGSPPLPHSLPTCNGTVPISINLLRPVRPPA